MNNLSKRYLELQIDNYNIQVKLDDEGVVLDVFLVASDTDTDYEPIASTYKFYYEFGLEMTEAKDE